MAGACKNNGRSHLLHPFSPIHSIPPLPCRVAFLFTLIDRTLNGIVDLHAKVAEHNRLLRLPRTRQGKHDGQEKVENDNEIESEDDIVPNQVDHEYDFGTWKGYAGQFSPEFVKELESHDEVEYVEEDTMMWAWDIEPSSSEQANGFNIDVDRQLEQGQEQYLDGMILKVNRSSSFDAEMVVNGRVVEYHSLKAPSWGLARISQRQRDLKKDYSYMSSAG